MNFILSFDRNWYDHLWLNIASIATTISLVFHYFLSPSPWSYFVRDSYQNHHPLPGHHHQPPQHDMTTSYKTKRSNIDATITILCLSSRWHSLIPELVRQFVWNKWICFFGISYFVRNGLIQGIFYDKNPNILMELK